MSWLSKHGGATFGALANPINPVGGFAGNSYDNKNNPKTNNVSAGGVSGNDTSNQTLQDIISKINDGASRGSYGEGAIGTAYQELSKLQDQVKAGKFSQADYVNIANQIVPQVSDSISRLMSGGSASATAATQAGGYKFLQDIVPTVNFYKDAQSLLGRDATANELAQFAPAYSDPKGGSAALAAYAQQQANTPEALAKKGPEHSADVNSVFQDLLKRGATQDEVNHFGGMIASGQLDPYTLKQFVQSGTEYQTQQDTNFRSGLSDELQGYDQKFFDRSKQDILSQFAKQGQSFGNSSSLDYALTDLMGKIAENRGQYLAGLSAQQYGNNKDAARQDYLGQQSNYMDQLNNTRQQNQGMQNYYTQRGNDLTDYNRQMADAMSYYKNLPHQNSGTGALMGALQGASSGSAGGAVGAGIGAGTGALFGYLNNR